MPSIGIDVSGDLQIVADLESKAAKVGAETFVVVRTWGLALNRAVQAHASGRPGPRVRTGDYRRSWSVITYTRLGGEAVAEAGTNAPQGPRLEFGFTGVDALGRHYNQPPFPHARPALTEVEGPFVAALEKVVGS